VLFSLSLSLSLFLSHLISRAKAALVGGQRVVHEVVDLPLVILACTAAMAGCGGSRGEGAGRTFPCA